MQIGNGSIYAINPGQLLFGANALNEMTGSNLPAKRNVAQAFGILASVPSGYHHPGAWQQPRTAGAMSSYRSAYALSVATGAGAMGINLTATALALAVGVASGQLIVSGTGSALALSDAEGNLVGVVWGDGTAAATALALASLNAPGWMDAAALAVCSGVLTSYGVGWMSGTTVDPSVLTADAIAAAVWARGLEGTVTAQQIQQRIAAILAGKVSGGPDKPTFKAIGSDEDRVHMEADDCGNRTEVDFL
jgi:hypothetical protein